MKACAYGRGANASKQGKQECQHLRPCGATWRARSAFYTHPLFTHHPPTLSRAASVGSMKRTSSQRDAGAPVDTSEPGSVQDDVYRRRRLLTEALKEAEAEAPLSSTTADHWQSLADIALHEDSSIDCSLLGYDLYCAARAALKSDNARAAAGAATLTALQLLVAASDNTESFLINYRAWELLCDAAGRFTTEPALQAATVVVLAVCAAAWPYYTTRRAIVQNQGIMNAWLMTEIPGAASRAAGEAPADAAADARFAAALCAAATFERFTSEGLRDKLSRLGAKQAALHRAVALWAQPRVLFEALGGTAALHCCKWEGAALALSDAACSVVNAFAQVDRPLALACIDWLPRLKTASRYCESRHVPAAALPLCVAAAEARRVKSGRLGTTLRPSAVHEALYDVAITTELAVAAATLVLWHVTGATEPLDPDDALKAAKDSGHTRELLEKIMTKHAKAPAVMLPTLAIMRHLSERTDDSVGISISTAEHLCKVLKAAPTRSPIAAQAVALLTLQGGAGDSVVARILHAEGAVGALIEVAKDTLFFDSSAGGEEEEKRILPPLPLPPAALALALLAAACRGSEDRRAAVVTCSGIEVAITAVAAAAVPRLELVPGAAPIEQAPEADAKAIDAAASSACLLLRALCFGSGATARRAAIVAAGGIEALSGAVTRRDKSTAVAAFGTAALQALCAGSESRIAAAVAAGGLPRGSKASAAVDPAPPQFTVDLTLPLRVSAMPVTVHPLMTVAELRKEACKFVGPFTAEAIRTMPLFLCGKRLADAWPLAVCTGMGPGASLTSS